MDPLRIAALAFAATADVAANRRAIAEAIASSAEAGMQLLAVPECALCGYPPATGALDAQSCALAEAEDGLLQLAASRGLVLVLGSAGPDGRGGTRNLALVGGAVPEQRLAKRVLTPADRAWFSPGPAASVIIAVAGWRIAIGICYEIRQAAWWYAAAAAGADAAVVIAHQAGSDADPGTKAEVLPALHAARAAELAMPLLLANTAAPDRWLDSAAWDARGRRIAGLGAGLLRVELEHRSRLDPWYETVRRDALEVARLGGSSSSSTTGQ